MTHFVSPGVPLVKMACCLTQLRAKAKSMRSVVQTPARRKTPLAAEKPCGETAILRDLLKNRG